MNPEIREITREDLITKANEIGIEEPHMMSTEELFNALNSYEKKRVSYNICRRLNRLGSKKIGKRQNLTKSDLREATRLNNKSLSDLQKLARLQRIANYMDLTKEDLIYTLLRSEKYLLENNYDKYININPDNDHQNISQ